MVRRNLLRLGKIAVTIGIFALLWHLTDGPEVINLLQNSDWRWLIAALAAAHAQVLLSALRWRVTAAQLDQHLPKRLAIGEYYLSQFVNLALPGGVLGDAGRAVRQRHQAGMLRAAQAVVLERLVGQIALFAVLFAGVLVVVIRPGGLTLPAWMAGLVGWIALGFMAVILVLVVLVFLPGPVARAMAGFGAAMRQAVLARHVWPVQLGLSVLIVACNIAIFAFAARAVGTELSFAESVTILPLVLLAMMIPLTIGGWGFREGAAAAIWPAIGASAEAGIAASIGFGLVILTASLPGIWVLLRRRQR
jgi:uncharacterized membrane protein YbhN (UPF0104 family)